MLHNEDIVVSDSKLKIIKKEKFFLCESYSGKSIELGNLEGVMYFYGLEKRLGIGYQWEQKSAITIATNGIGHRFKTNQKCQFIYDRNKFELTYFEEMASVESGSLCPLFKSTTYDSLLNVINVKILDTRINPLYKNDIFVTELFTTVVHQESDSILNITSYDKKGLHGYSVLNFKVNSVKEWKILSTKFNNSTLYFPYLIIKLIDGQTTIWSLSSNQTINGNFQSIAPISCEFEKQYYSRKMETIFYPQYKIAIYIDGNVYNDQLQKFECDDFLISHIMTKGTLLDICAGNIALENNGIYILTIDYNKQEILNVTYVYKEVDDTPILSFFTKMGLSNDSRFIAFNIKKKRFSVNVDLIYSELRKINDYSEHYSIMDALDGDSEAYWNID